MKRILSFSVQFRKLSLLAVAATTIECVNVLCSRAVFVDNKNNNKKRKSTFHRPKISPVLHQHTGLLLEFVWEFGCGGRRVCVRVSYSKCALTILRSSLFSTCVQVLNITLHSTADTNDRGKQDRIESERKKEKRKEMDEARKGQK